MTATPLLALILLLPAPPKAAPPKAQAPVAQANKAKLPVTPKRPVTDTHHKTAVTEDYRWLEIGDAPEVKAWSAAQTVYARGYLDGLPAREAIARRVSGILSAEVASHGALAFAGGQLFALKRQPPKQQAFLVVMPSADAPAAERVLVDPNALDPKGLTHIDWYRPSPDGRLVAVSLSVGGTESGDVHVFEVATGKPLPGEVIPRVNGGTAGGDLAWDPDGSGFFYTRYPRGEERPPEDRDFYQQLWHHRLGAPQAEDRYELGRDLPRIAEIQIRPHHPSGRLLATVQDGDGGEFAHFLRDPDGRWRQFSRFDDKVLQAAFGAREDLYLLSREGAPRGKLLRLPLDEVLDPAKAQVVIPEGEDTLIEDFWGPPTIYATPSRLLIGYQQGGPSTLRVFDLEGKPLAAPDLPPVSSTGGLTPLGGEAVLIRSTSYVAPPAWYHYDAGRNVLRRTALVTEAVVDFGDCEVVREFATSKDGTQVPLNIIRPKGAKADGQNKVVLYGYGGYGVNLEPRFNPVNRVLLEQGVWYVVANLRGGGEYGETWHRQGNLTRKQNVFDDFHAGLQHLVAKGYTRPEHIAILGGSNGGLLMGASLVQHPQAVRAVVALVGIYDMLRVELSANGAFNVPEFGTVKDPEHFKAMYAYSPYHNVVDGAAYPPALFVTGENDPRVDPMQSRKMVARLQAAQGGPGRILLRTSQDAGHGAGTGLQERIAQSVDVYAFLFAELGVKYRAVGGAKQRK